MTAPNGKSPRLASSSACRMKDSSVLWAAIRIASACTDVVFMPDTRLNPIAKPTKLRRLIITQQPQDDFVILTPVSFLGKQSKSPKARPN
jgi:hypothetical protein